MTGPTPVPTVNPLASTAVGDLNTLISDGETAAETAIITAEPVMATPVLKQIWEAMLGALIGWVFQPILDAFTGKIIIDLEEYQALKAAVAAQTALDSASQSGDLNAQAQAQAILDSAVAKAAQYVGAVQPSS